MVFELSLLFHIWHSHNYPGWHVVPRLQARHTWAVHIQVLSGNLRFCVSVNQNKAKKKEDTANPTPSIANLC